MGRGAGCSYLLLLLLLRRRVLHCLLDTAGKPGYTRAHAHMRARVVSQPPGGAKEIGVKIDITSKVTVEIDLRATPYADWPQRAKDLARIVVEREMRKTRTSRQPDMLFRDLVIAKVEWLATQDEFEL